jgi:tellurite resistance protein TerC
MDLVPTFWHWSAFLGCVLVFLALDLGVFHRTAHVVRFSEALAWTVVWCSVAMLFAFVIAPRTVEGWGRQETLEFITGYLVELSLSMDNVFVIALIFTYFRIPPQYQHRVLFWGILGALIMRGVMIGAGAALVREFMWTLYFFGIFLVFTGIKMLFASDEGVNPEQNPLLRLARKFFPVSTRLDGQRFFTELNGRRALTPLALVLLLVESTDLIFAVDSIPAIFAITTKPFIVFTSNVFAILGLRSLYFVLAGAIGYFRYLKVGLATVLVFIGLKMLLAPHAEPPLWWQFKISPGLSLAVVGGILFIAIVSSLLAAWLEHSRRAKSR